MGGIFGVVSDKDASLDLFFGVDYHSHLGTRRGGLAVQFDSVDEKMYEKMNGISGSNFQKALKTVAMLSQIFPSHVYPQFTRMNANEEQLESFYRFWKEKTFCLRIQ